MINSFRGEHSFLSNFYVYEGSSVEHKYQAAKATNITDYKLIMGAESPSKAKKLSKRIQIREDWDDIKLIIMEHILREKFSNKILAMKLISTEPHDLIEGNDWGDTFWGVCHGEGENNLGKLLMKIRKDFLSPYTTKHQDMKDLISY